MGTLVTTALLQPVPGRSFHPRLEAFPDILRAPLQLPTGRLRATLPGGARRGLPAHPGERRPQTGAPGRAEPVPAAKRPPGAATSRRGGTGRAETLRGGNPTGCEGGTAANSPEPSLPRTGPESRKAPANRQGAGRGAAPRPPRRPPPLPAVPTEEQGREPHGGGAAQSRARESGGERRAGRVTAPSLRAARTSAERYGPWQPPLPL